MAQYSKEEVRKAVRYLEELSDPAKFERWVDRVMEGWAKRRGKSSRRS